MRNKSSNYFQRRPVPVGFKGHAQFDDFIQKSLDKFTFSEPLPEMYEAAGVYSRYIISDKSAIPDLIIYNKTFNKNDCFENCSSKAFNSFPRVRFILNTQQKEKHAKKSNRNKRQYVFVEVKDERDIKAKQAEEEEPEWGKDDIEEFKKSKIVFQAIPSSKINEKGEDKESKKNSGLNEVIAKEEMNEQLVEPKEAVPVPEGTIEEKKESIGNEELKKLVTQTEDVSLNEQLNSIEENRLRGEVKETEQEGPQQSQMKEEKYLTNPNHFLAQIQENNKKLKEKELNYQIIEEIKQCEDIFEANNQPEAVIDSLEQEPIKEPPQENKQETINHTEESQPNSTIPTNKPIPPQQMPSMPSMLNPQGADFSKMPFMPGVPPYMCYPYLQPFQMPPPFNYPMNPMMNPMMSMPQMGMNLSPNLMPPFQPEDEDEEEDDPMMNNFNDNFHRYNPTVFLENPALIVKKNLIESNWFVMKDSKILGNYNSEQLLFFLGEQIRQQNKFDGISITDYHTDVFFKPNNLFDILRKNVPKLKKKYLQTTMQTMMMNMPMMNSTMRHNMVDSHNREGNMQMNKLSQPMNQSKSHLSNKK